MSMARMVLFAVAARVGRSSARIAGSAQHGPAFPEALCGMLRSSRKLHRIVLERL